MSEDRPTTDYDVVVIGFGDAGACAAIAAAENGASVLVLDRGHGGGASALSGGVVYAGGGTPYQREAGYQDTPENMFDYLRQEVRGAVDDQTLRAFCEGSVDRLAWLEAHGARFAGSLCPYKTSYPTDEHYLYFSGNEKAHPYNASSSPAPRGHRQVAKGLGSGKALWSALAASAQALGVVFEPLSHVDELVVTDGRVTGVRYRGMAQGDASFSRHRRLAGIGGKLGNWVPPIGKRINARAADIWAKSSQERTVTARSVVLAAGGFVYDRALVHESNPAYDQVSPLGTVGDDGAGIRLGQSVGGAVSHMDRMTAWRFLSPPSALVEGVSVGVDGRRIANEDLYGATHSEVLLHEFGGRGYLVVDATTWRKARGQVREQTMLFQLAQVAPLFLFAHEKASTLEGLAGKLGISATGLRATVDAYNEGIATGTGDPAHKALELCAPIRTGPFYGIDITVRPTGMSLVPGLTLGGLRVEGSTGLVLDEAGATIPGLYAAGRTAVGVCSTSYVSGLAIADCVFSGKRAGEHAAAAVPTPSGERTRR